MKNEESIIGKKIRELRLANGDTLKQLAKKIDYDPSNLSKVERGLYGIDLDLLQKIVKTYEVDSNYFFYEFTKEEGELLLEEDLSPQYLEQKYSFKVDGVEATQKEIEEAIRLIRHFRNSE